MAEDTGTLNVPTKECATERVESANALRDTKERLVGVNPAQAIVPGMELVNT